MEQVVSNDDWTFLDASTRDYTHVYHDYPARMIPQVARKLIHLYGKSAKTLYDPYCGTGSSLVEGLLEGLDVFGTDINPLARLIAESKTDYSINPDDLSNEIANFQVNIYSKGFKVNIPEIRNVETWFKGEVLEPLGKIRHYVDEIQDTHIRRFFQVAFSETVRESSNTRKGEFKLFRYAPEKLKTHSPDPYKIMLSKLERNFRGYTQFNEMMKKLGKAPKATILGLNSVYDIPSKELPEDSVDIVVTSPPYGDSHTTVAYGQYSRLSSEWLSLINGENIDNKLMGGKKLKELPVFPSRDLNAAIQLIYGSKPARALEVASFYSDLYSSIKNVSKLIRKGGYACYVVGNRTVNSVLLPTSIAIRDFFEANGFEYVTTHIREIPNKRMPKRNSPSNVAGETSSTMLNEHIVVMNNPKN
jgi:tRNA G10  N-methylase Trm11